MAFSPGEALRSIAESDLMSAVNTLSKYGIEPSLLDAYNAQGGVSEYPHHQLRRHVEDNRYNLLIYYGHGDAGRWAFSLPQDSSWAAYPETPQGRDEAVLFGDQRSHWQQEIQLAGNAMVIMRHTCYSMGLEACDMQNGARLLDQGEVLRRINEYSGTFLSPHTGIRSYAALADIGATSSYLESLFANHGLPIGALTVPDESAGHQPGDGYQYLSGPHFCIGGMAYRKSRYGGTTNQAVWSHPAWAGDPGLNISTVLGQVPGDHNGDGDNTDLGEPCFPHDRRDVFDGEDASYNFFPFLCIANPGAAGTWAQVTFYNREGEYFSIYREVPALSRITIDLNANRYLRDRNLAIRVRSVDGVPLLAERPMYFRYGGWMDGGSVAFGSAAPRTSWYFAEGYACEDPLFREYVCLGNFSDKTARGLMTLMGEDGKTTSIAIEVPAGTRRTHYVNSYLTGNVSVKVDTDQPIVAERSIYFNYRAVNGRFTADGGNTKQGIGALSSYWYFAEGHVSEVFEEWISLANPDARPATAELTYYTPQGEYASREVYLPPQTRRTVYVNESFPSPQDVSVAVRADRPIACERSMYFNYGGAWDDGHVSFGNTAPSRRWRFAEGSAYPGINEYVLIMNPGSEPATVYAAYMLGPGEGTHRAVYHVGAGKRLTVNVNDELAVLGNPSQVALELLSDRDIVAERAMYFFMGRAQNGKEPIRGGHVSLGVQDASPEWYFSEAYTGN
jgi:hypothetical protein